MKQFVEGQGPFLESHVMRWPNPSTHIQPSLFSSQFGMGVSGDTLSQRRFPNTTNHPSILQLYFFLILRSESKPNKYIQQKNPMKIDGFFLFFYSINVSSISKSHHP